IHEIFRKAGDLGLLGICKPEKFGGMGLDYSYSIVAAEEFGTIRCGGIPMSIGVQTDMCTPALARFGRPRCGSCSPTASVWRVSNRRTRT
ncbi:acyl-CoA dehydrogenase family protein, partial [Salmonella enterica]|uniref:acyl-CoA dehydrogenase family protein n=1 Tax=Salmonella enterica TaxID=28901 RepID=UPI003075B233